MNSATHESPKRVLQTIADENNANLMSEEATAITPNKQPTKPAAPGKKWVKVKRTETSMDAKGYMCTQDVEVWEEVDDVKPAKRSTAAAKKSAGEKMAPLESKAAKPKVQRALADFFKSK